jgi:hypothetical protein
MVAPSTFQPSDKASMVALSSLSPPSDEASMASFPPAAAQLIQTLTARLEMSEKKTDRLLNFLYDQQKNSATRSSRSRSFVPPSMKNLFESISRDERISESSAVDITAEKRSQDSDIRPRDRNGYVKDAFVATDDSSSDPFSSSDSLRSSDEDTTYAPSDDSSSDADFTVACKSVAFSLFPTVQDPFPTSCSPEEAKALSTPIVLKRRAKQYIQVELLLSSWLSRPSLSSVTKDEFLLFLVLLSRHRGEFVSEIFKHVIRRFAPLSKPFVRLIWQCIKRALPHFKHLFSQAYTTYNPQRSSSQNAHGPTLANTAAPSDLAMIPLADDKRKKKPCA